MIITKSFLKNLKFSFFLLVLFFICFNPSSAKSGQCKHEHIIIIVADDLGWNDCSIHGSRQFPTPNFDGLATCGHLIERHYSQNLCTPSRVALNTGLMPYKIGMQGNPIVAGSKAALPTTFKILPEYFSEMNYETHLVGKWHLGSHKTCYMPTRRGWKSFFGSLNGFTDMNSQTHRIKPPYVGGDTYRNEEPAFAECTGEYVTQKLTFEAVNVINKHNVNKPLLLMLTHNGPHANNPGATIMARTPNGWGNQICDHIKDRCRQGYADAVKEIDDSIASIITALHEKDLLRCSTIVFFSDNGGATVDHKFHYENCASNWPLRGMKMSPFEGGVRTVAAMWTNQNTKPKLHPCPILLCDWMPSLYAAAGGNVSRLGKIDGINQWKNLISDKKKDCVRKEFFPELSKGSQAFISDYWKIVQSFPRGSPKAFSSEFWGDSGREDSLWSDNEIARLAATSKVAQILYNYSSYNYDLEEEFKRKRNEAMLDNKCKERIENNAEGYSSCSERPCLFDLRNDTCETTDVSSQNPEVFKYMMHRLTEEMKLLKPKVIYDTDPRSLPQCWSNMWTTWLDRKPLVNYTCPGPIPGLLEPEDCDNDFKLY